MRKTLKTFKQAKTFFIVVFIFDVFILSGVVNLLKVKENTTNFIFFYILIPSDFFVVILISDRAMDKKKKSELK